MLPEMEAVHDISYVDDASAYTWSPDPQTVVDNVKNIVAIYHEEFLRHGLQLNYAAGKSECLLAPRGKGAKAVRERVFVDDKPKITVESQTGTLLLRVVDAYKHLGGIVTSSGSQSRELRARIKAMYVGVAALSRPVMVRHEVPVNVDSLSICQYSLKLARRSSTACGSWLVGLGKPFLARARSSWCHTCETRHSDTFCCCCVFFFSFNLICQPQFCTPDFWLKVSVSCFKSVFTLCLLHQFNPFLASCPSFSLLSSPFAEPSLLFCFRWNRKSRHDTSVVTSHVYHVMCLYITTPAVVFFVYRDVVQLLLNSLWSSACYLFLSGFFVHRVQRPASSREATVSSIHICSSLCWVCNDSHLPAQHQHLDLTRRGSLL